MDLSVKTFDNTAENLKMLRAKGYKLSSVSKPNSPSRVIRVSQKRRVYWFTNKFVARCIEADITRMSVGTIYYGL